MHDTTVTDVHPRPAPPVEKEPGHSVLARLGKRVLRPGGVELTEAMLAALSVDRDDDVVELAPGRGATAMLTLERGPRSYTGIEADPAWAQRLERVLGEKGPVSIAQGDAGASGLADGCASVVYGEAMLTMHSARHKARIVAEAARLLRSGGRYGIHELCIVPDDLDEEAKAAIRRDLSISIHVGARPLTVSEWRTLLEEAGLEVRCVETAPMYLLEPRRVVDDEGLARSLMIAANLARLPAERRRVLDMRRVFREHEAHLAAVALVAAKT